MSEDNNMFDENNAIKFIRQYMPVDIAMKYSDDEILNIIDMIWDFYEDNGFLEIPADDAGDAEPELPQIMAYVNKMLAKDKLAVVDTADVHYIVEGELEYEKSLDVDA
nr:hypothetical protein IL210_00041 [uncultured bacterium]QTC34814.1 hypothetical protein IL214_00038 [uncultured bacterium]